MKRSLLILAALVSLFFSNCKKNAADPSETTKDVAVAAGYTVTAQNLLNVESLKALASQDVKKTAFGLLLPIEKYLVWVENAKIASVNFNPQQKALVLEFINYLSPQLFEKSQSGSVDTFRDQWLAKAQKVFTYSQIRSVAYQLFASTDTKNTLAINAAAAVSPSCNCNGGSYFTCESDAYCPTDNEHGSCSNPSKFGCGFAIAYPCDNFCVTPGAKSE